MVKKFPLSNFKLWLFISVLFTFSNAFSANWYVNDNSTTGDVYCTAVGNNSNNGNSPATPKLTLLAAYTAAAAGDTIFIDTGTYSGAGNINLTVAKANLTFTGAGSLKTVFDNNLASANSNLWLTINANNININGISATEFNAISAGKVVTVNGQTVTFNDVIFFNNGNQGNGAIYITSNSNVTYSNSSTTCNASLLFGGGIDLVGNNSVLNITNCIIATNKKEDNGDGGGVLVKGNGNNVTITNTRFEKNDAVNGGAICIMGGTSVAPNLVNITGSCFENNKVSQVSSVVNGAAICIGRGGSTINVTDCSFTNNLAGTAASQTGNGGAISVNTGIVGGLSGLSGTATLNLVRCNFSGNNATAVGKHIYGDVVTGPAAVTINQCTFTSAGNFDIAQKTAGEIAFTVTNSGAPTVSNLTLTNSVAPTQTAATVCQTFTGNGCTLPAPCTASLSYPNSSICSSASTQTPTFSPTGGTFTSTTGLSINALTGVITPSSSTAGTYTVTYTPNSADPTCKATFSITIVAAPNAGTNGTLTICAGSTVTATQLFAQLVGSPASGGTWSPTLAGAGTYTYSVAAISPCTTAATATVTVTEQTQPNAGTNGTLTICAGSTVTATQLFAQLGGSPSTGGAWSPTLAGAGTYTYSVSATSPCTTPATATVTVTEQTQPNAGTNGTLTICAGITVTATQLFAQLGGSPASGGTWTPTLAGAGTYTYTVAATSPCTTAATATVTVTTQAQPNAGSNGTLTICAVTTVTASQLFAQLGGSPASGGTWSPALAGAGTYTYTVAATSPCTTAATATVTVTEQAAPNAGSNGTLTICAGTTVTASQLFAQLGGSPALGGTWSPALAGAGTYTYTVAATSPCTTAATATVTVTEQAAPNAGSNGTLTICAGTTVTASQLFAQLGGSPSTGGAWSPTLAGAGTYTYSISATSPCTTAATATVTVSDSQPAQPTTACYQTATFNTTTCSWDVTGTQPTQPTATNCWDNYQFNTTSCTWINNGTQPTQPTATNCWDDYQFNTTSCTWVNNGSQPTQPTATNCWDDYQFNTTSCTWVNNGTQPTQPTATNCWDDYQFNTTSCTWVNNGTQPTQPTATNCWDDYQFNTTSCTWVNNGTQPTQPTATNCWDDYQFNTTSCSWVNNGSQPTQPTATNCWDDYQFNTTSCTWVNNGSQPTQPTATNCWDDYQFNTTSCSWVNNGSQPTQPTATNCWDDYQFNTTSCSWVNNGSQPTQPTATNCWDDYQFNTTSCTWVNNGSQPTQPTATNCWDDYQFNTTSCTWVNNGSQPTQPTATNCWDDYQFNTTSCTWVNNGSQPTQPPATNCWDDYQFNTTSCSWVNNGSQPTQPTATNCWDDYQFNTTSCSWVNNGSQPTQPTATNCWDDYQFNTTSCTWVNNGSQPTQPTATNCWDDYQFNTTSCTWVNNGSQPTQPTATNCWDDYQFNTTSCTWVNNGSQPTQPTATNCWDDYQFNTTSCTWVNNGSQPTQPTATNCWDDYQFNTTSCTWVNNGSQPTQPTTTNCWDDYQFNTTSCTWVNNGSQPTQPTATNCWDDYQFNTTSCTWVNNGSQPTQPTATNCWDDYQFNTTSCTWVNNGENPVPPTLACYQTATFNTTTCSWDVTGTQQPAPLITVNNAVCSGSTYSVEFNSNGTIVASSGIINGNTVSGITVGTDLTLTATSSNGCAITSISIISPTNCITPRGCVNPILSAGQGTCSGTGTYSFAFNVSQNADISTSAGTVFGNTVINIPIGTTVTLTATDGLCSTSIQVTSPLDCSTPCGSPLASFSAGICNGHTYSISISNPNGAIISSSLGTVTATAITGIPTGASVTVTSSLSGCISQQITILSPIKIAPMLVVSNPICNGSTYSVTYSSNGSIDISSGSLGSESITGIPVGTDLLIIASSLNGCASTTMTVKSPLNCANPPTDCVMPTLSAGQGICAGTGTYSFAFNASVGALVTVSSGTISGNAVTGIALGTNVTLTATNGSCVTSLVVNSPTDCSTPCATPVVSFSAGICNGTTYSINISNPNNATITTSAGIVTATAITGIPIGTSVTITSSISGCLPQIITISSPLIPVNPNAGNDGSIEICDGDVPTNSELFAALGGNPQLGGSWSNSGNIYTYTVMAASSCASLPLDRATVTVSTIIINDFEIVGHCNDTRYQLTINPVQSDAVYTWYNGIGDLIGTGNSMYINASDTYEVKSSKSICSKIKSIYIEDIHCIIPKGVSPNGDGLNDTWDLSNMNVEKAQIFNRYGMEMYSKSNYTDEWHGQTNDGQMLPSATYYYVLRFLDGTSKTGWVYLNREQ